MTRRLRISLYSLATIAALLMIAVTVALNLDFGRYKSFAEELLSEELARSFEIRGPLEVTLGSSIRLLAEDVRIANTDWSEDASLLQVAHLDLSIDTWSLISGPMLIESLLVEGIQLNLEKREDGQNNWTFGTEEPVVEEEESAAIDELPILMQVGNVSNFTLTYRSAGLQNAIVFTVAEFSESILDSGEIALNGHGLLNRTPYSMSATVGGVEQLVDLRNVAAHFNLSLGEISFEGDALIDQLFDPNRPELRIQLLGPNAEYLTDVLGVPRISSGALRLDASVSPDADRMKVSIDGVFGDFTANAGGSFVDLHDLSNLHVVATAAGPSAATLGELVGYDALPDDSFHIDGEATITGSNIAVDNLHLQIGEMRLDAAAQFADFPRADGAAAKLQINGSEFGHFNRMLGLPGQLTGPFRLDASIESLPERRAAVKLDASSKDVSITADGIVVDAPAYAGTKLDLTYAGPNFKAIAGALGLSDAPADSFEALVSFEKTANGFAVPKSVYRIGEDRLEISGVVGEERLLRDTDLKFDVRGPNLAKTLTAFGLDAGRLPTTAWYSSGRVFGDDHGFNLQEISVAIGADREYQFGAAGLVTDQADFIGSTMTVTAQGPRLDAIAYLAGIDSMPASAYDIAANIERVTGGYQVHKATLRVADDTAVISGKFGEDPMQGGANAKFAFDAPDLKATLASFNMIVDELPAGPFSVKGTVQHRGADIMLQKVTASLAGTTATLDGKLGALPTLDGTSIAISVSGNSLNDLVGDLHGSRALAEPFSFHTQLELKKSMVSLNDVVALVGQVRTTASLSTSRDDLLQRGTFSILSNAPDFGALWPAYDDAFAGSGVPMTFKADGRWDENFWQFDDFLLTVGEGRLSIDGTLDGPPDFAKTDVAFALHVANVRNLSGLAGHELPVEAATLTGRLTGTRDQITLSDFDARLGDSDIDGEFSLTGGDVPLANVRLSSKKLDLGAYIPPPEEREEEANLPPRDKVIPDTPLPLDSLRKFDAIVDVQFGELVLRQKAVSNVSLVGALKDGQLKVSDFSLDSASGELSANFALLADGSQANLLLAISGQSVIVGLPAATAADVLALPRYDIEVMLHGKGATASELAGSLNGFVRLASGPGRINVRGLRIFTQDFLFELLNRVNPFVQKDPYTNIKCMAVLITATDGVVAGDPSLIVQSDKLNIFGVSTIDLKTESLNADFNTVAQTGIGISLANLVNPFTKVSGTLAKPALILDTKGALIEGGAAVATAGLSFVALRVKDRFFSAKDPCGKAAGEREKEFEKMRQRYRAAIAK